MDYSEYRENTNGSSTILSIIVFQSWNSNQAFDISLIQMVSYCSDHSGLSYLFISKPILIKIFIKIRICTAKQESQLSSDTLQQVDTTIWKPTQNSFHTSWSSSWNLRFKYIVARSLRELRVLWVTRVIFFVSFGFR